MEPRTKKNRVVAIAQARLGSSRLPLKSLLNLGHMPVIDWVLDRLSAAASLDHVLVAVPDTDLDRVLSKHLAERGADCFMGPESDVLARFHQAAQAAEATHVVRICADNPLVSGEAIDRLVDFYFSGDYDYAYNHIPRNNLWPDGLGAEMVSARLLADLHTKANAPAQREHCFNYIWDNAAQFRIGTFDPAESWLARPDIKLDIDTAEDFRRLSMLSLNPKSNFRNIVSAWDTCVAEARQKGKNF